MAYESVGQATLRAENVSKIVTGFALKEYKMKQLCLVDSSNSWIESYYREAKAEMTGGTGQAVKGVARLANFPYGEMTWEKVSAYQEKHGMEAQISIEDALMDNVDVIARTLKRIARAVALSVDTTIYNAMSGATGINTYAISAGNEWNSATVANRQPIKDILNAIRELQIDNYDPLSNDGYLVLSTQDYVNIISNSQVLQNPTFRQTDVVSNGVVGQLCGLKLLVSETVAADNAFVIIGKEAMTWKSALPLTVETMEDKGIKYTIRAYEIGTAMVTNPEAICKITNTQA